MIENLKCPKCDGPMVSRANGASGQRFWGCKKYPECRGTLNTDGEVPTRQNSQRRTQDDSDELSPSERARRDDRSRWRS